MPSSCANLLATPCGTKRGVGERGRRRGRRRALRSLPLTPAPPCSEHSRVKSDALSMKPQNCHGVRQLRESKTFLVTRLWAGAQGPPLYTAHQTTSATQSELWASIRRFVRTHFFGHGPRRTGLQSHVASSAPVSENCAPQSAFGMTGDFPTCQQRHAPGGVVEQPRQPRQPRRARGRRPRPDAAQLAGALLEAEGRAAVDSGGARRVRHRPRRPVEARAHRRARNAAGRARAERALAAAQLVRPIDAAVVDVDAGAGAVGEAVVHNGVAPACGGWFRSAPYSGSPRLI